MWKDWNMIVAKRIVKGPKNSKMAKWYDIGCWETFKAFHCLTYKQRLWNICLKYEERLTLEKGNEKGMVYNIPVFSIGLLDSWFILDTWVVSISFGIMIHDMMHTILDWSIPSNINQNRRIAKYPLHLNFTFY